MENKQKIYEDISDDLLYISQNISLKVRYKDFDLTQEIDYVKAILKRLESIKSN